MKISYYSQYGTIIRAFQDHPGVRLGVAYFQNCIDYITNYYLGK